MRTYEEVDALIELTRSFYAECAAFRTASAEGRLSPAEDAKVQRRLERMDARIEGFKGNNELERCRAKNFINIIPMTPFGRKAAR